MKLQRKAFDRVRVLSLRGVERLLPREDPKRKEREEERKSSADFFVLLFPPFAFCVPLLREECFLSKASAMRVDSRSLSSTKASIASG